MQTARVTNPNRGTQNVKPYNEQAVAATTGDRFLHGLPEEFETRRGKCPGNGSTLCQAVASREEPFRRQTLGMQPGTRRRR
jgi:hypothetical protein